MQPIRMLLIALMPLAMLAADTAPSVPLKEVKGVTANEAAFQASGSTKPIVLKSEKEAGAYFAADELAKLMKEADFKTQIVLVFAWSGSGQDKLDYTIAESYPEQISFKYTAGLTRDLRPQTHIYVLRTNVSWQAK